MITEGHRLPAPVRYPGLFLCRRRHPSGPGSFEDVPLLHGRTGAGGLGFRSSWRLRSLQLMVRWWEWICVLKGGKYRELWRP